MAVTLGHGTWRRLFVLGFWGDFKKHIYSLSSFSLPLPFPLHSFCRTRAVSEAQFATENRDAAHTHSSTAESRHRNTFRARRDRFCKRCGSCPIAFFFLLSMESFILMSCSRVTLVTRPDPRFYALLDRILQPDNFNS
jgi:hypothetical protein